MAAGAASAGGGPQPPPPLGFRRKSNIGLLRGGGHQLDTGALIKSNKVVDLPMGVKGIGGQSVCGFVF